MLPAGLKKRLAASPRSSRISRPPGGPGALRIRWQRGEGPPRYRGLPAHHRRSRRHRQDRARIPGAVRGPRRRHGPLRRRHPARGRHPGRLRAHEPHSRNRPGKRARRGASPAWSIWISPLAVEGSGYFYRARSLQPAACTIGGNVAENAGGPHTLAYGVTTNHVLGLELVLPDGIGGRNRRQGAGPAGLRSDRPADRLGRHHGAGHQGHRAADAQAGGGEDAAGDLRFATRTPAARWPRSPPAPSRRWRSRCWMA